jgi:hypothetical protein
MTVGGRGHTAAGVSHAFAYNLNTGTMTGPGTLDSVSVAVVTVAPVPIEFTIRVHRRNPGHHGARHP